MDLKGAVGCRQWAAVGGVSVAYMDPLTDCQPEHTLPLMTFHGTADPIVPYQGGPSDLFDVLFVVVPDWMASLAELMGCAAAENLEEQVGIAHRTYSSSRDGAELVFFALDGVGHS